MRYRCFGDKNLSYLSADPLRPFKPLLSFPYDWTPLQSDLYICNASADTIGLQKYRFVGVNLIDYLPEVIDEGCKMLICSRSKIENIQRGSNSETMDMSFLHKHTLLFTKVLCTQCLKAMQLRIVHSDVSCYPTPTLNNSPYLGHRYTKKKNKQTETSHLNTPFSILNDPPLPR